jgi:hypothetical protein
MAFLSGTTWKELVRELGRNTPTTANELMDIVTNYAAGEEAIGAIFGGDQDKGKRKDKDPKIPTGAPRGTTGRIRRTSRANAKPRQTILSPLLIVRSLEAPRRGHH